MTPLNDNKFQLYYKIIDVDIIIQVRNSAER